LRINKANYILYICLIPFLTGCLGVQYLKNDEKLLLRQSISAAKGVPKKAIPKGELNNLYSQETNRRMLWLPISPLVSLYYTGEKHFDPDKYQRKKEKIQARFDKKIAKIDSSNFTKINNLQFRLREKLEKQDYKIENGNLFMQWGEPVAIYDSAKIEETKARFHIYLFSKII
jgi:hypothetical protein